MLFIILRTIEITNYWNTKYTYFCIYRVFQSQEEAYYMFTWCYELFNPRLQVHKGILYCIETVFKYFQVDEKYSFVAYFLHLWRTFHRLLLLDALRYIHSAYDISSTEKELCGILDYD